MYKEPIYRPAQRPWISDSIFLHQYSIEYTWDDTALLSVEDWYITIGVNIVRSLHNIWLHNYNDYNHYNPQ